MTKSDHSGETLANSASKIYKLATRGSALALWQSQFIVDQLRAHHLECTLSIIKTTGDLVQDRFLSEMGGKGAFIKELEDAMIKGECDLAMHSLKDMPVEIPQGFVLGAILKRHSVLDAMIFRKDLVQKLGLQTAQFITKEFLASLGPLKVGTSSLRRRHLLEGASSFITVTGLRGNVDTRIRKLHESKDLDAIILAKASLDRLGLDQSCAFTFDPEWFVPSPGQGAIAVELPATSPILPIVSKLDCQSTRQAVELERTILKRLGGDCTMPIGAWIGPSQRQSETGLLLRVAVLGRGNLKATSVIHIDQAKGFDQDSIVNRCLAELKKAGVNDVLASLNIEHRI